jgi:hypothetical protein
LIQTVAAGSAVMSWGSLNRTGVIPLRLHLYRPLPTGRRWLKSFGSSAKRMVSWTTMPSAEWYL